MKKTLMMLALALGCGSIQEAAAQSHAQQVKTKVDSTLTERYYKTPYDTNYVTRPEGKLTLRLRLNQTGNDIHTRSTINGVKSKSDLKTSYKTTVSIGASYLGVSAALAINPAKMGGKYNDYELNLNYYSNRFSIDASYQRASSLSGDIRRGSESHELMEGTVDMKMLNVAAYYAFNHRKFSFPAAFTQSYIQRRSAGSWLAGLSYMGCVIDVDTPDARLYIGHLGIGGGYGYNWVPSRKWLIHLSLLPTFVIFNRNNLTMDGERVRARHMHFNMIFNERAAIIYNFSSRYFAGATLVMNNSVFSDDEVTVNQNKWRARALIGVRL